VVGPCSYRGFASLCCAATPSTHHQPPLPNVTSGYAERLSPFADIGRCSGWRWQCRTVWMARVAVHGIMNRFSTSPQMTDVALAENVIHAGQAAWWYPLRMPPKRGRRWTSRRAIWACSVRASAMFVVVGRWRCLGAACESCRIARIPAARRVDAAGSRSSVERRCALQDGVVSTANRI
jgi:hypothetical protein